MHLFSFGKLSCDFANSLPYLSKPIITVASVPDLPRFDLPFAFTTIHGIGNGRGLGTRWSLQLVCNHGNHSQVKTTNLFWVKNEKFILVLEANCISNLSPNHTVQLTTLRTSVRESLQLYFINMMLLISWWLSHRCSVVTDICKVMHAVWCKQVWLLPRWLPMQDGCNVVWEAPLVVLCN